MVRSANLTQSTKIGWPTAIRWFHSFHRDIVCVAERTENALIFPAIKKQKSRCKLHRYRRIECKRQKHPAFHCNTDRRSRERQNAFSYDLTRHWNGVIFIVNGFRAIIAVQIQSLSNREITTNKSNFGLDGNGSQLIIWLAQIATNWHRNSTRNVYRVILWVYKITTFRRLSLYLFDTIEVIEDTEGTE